MCDALGNPLAFHLTPGEAHDLAGADALLPAVLARGAKMLIADKAYDAEERILSRLRGAGAAAVIPQRSSSRAGKRRAVDWHLYKRRHLIENLFARLKQYRAIATRYDKRASNFLGAVYLAASLCWLN